MTTTTTEPATGTAPHARVTNAGNDVLNTLKRERVPVTGDLSDDEARCTLRLKRGTWEGPSIFPIDPAAVARVAAQERDVTVEFDGDTATFTR